MKNVNAASLMKLALTIGGAGAVVALLRVPKKPMTDLNGKVVVIAGGSRGLGLALAEVFARHGSSLVLAARDDQELRAAQEILLAKKLIHSAANVLLVPCDLTKVGEPEHLISAALARFHRIDVLVNNAGVIHVGPVEKQSPAVFRNAMESDFFAMLETTYAALPHLLARREGSIVNIASIAGKVPVPHLAPYAASKFATVGFSETLHAELRSKGISVLTVNPGLLRTGSSPNALITGEKEQEYRWFKLAAVTPGIAHSPAAAAAKILEAIRQGCAEIEIGWDASLAARLQGISPATTQYLGHLAHKHLLPQPAGTTRTVAAHKLSDPVPALWSLLSRMWSSRYNQPAA